MEGQPSAEKHRVQLKPATMLNPVPVVMVSCGTMDASNIITVAWTGTINSDPPMVSISIRKERYSHSVILQSQCFAVNLVSRSLTKAADYCGVRSGREVDKFEECGLAKLSGPVTGVPLITDSPLCLECQVKQILELGSHDLFLAEVVGVSARPDVIDKQDSLRLDQAQLVSYCHGEYYELGQYQGFFGFSLAKEAVLRKRWKGKSFYKNKK